MNTKQQVQYYDSIPTVPQDFDGAVAVHAESLKAEYFWKEEIKTIDNILYPKLYEEARGYLRQWQRVKQEASEVIKTYQLKLF